jgi:hypothetical protein
MKKLYTLLTAVVLTANVFAQAPAKMSYQAVLRGPDNELVASQEAVGMQVSVLQGSVSGDAVYVETQIPSSNANGLVNLEIGTGNVESGDFTTIDWSAGPYFIKTETDPTGGIAYTITGTSQLMSVPYALHAKTAGNGISTAQVNEITANTAKVGLTDEQSTILANTSNTNTGDQDISGIVSNTAEIAVNTAKTGITSVQANEISSNAALIAALEARITALESQPAVIGDFRYGGVVFWVDPNDNTHGLVCAVEDQSSGIQWYNGSYITTNATGTAIGTGQANTTAIISVQGATETNYAAGLAKDYSGGGYTDWFLPSKDELNEMYLNKASIDATAFSNGGSDFAVNFYWSSTEYDASHAWGQAFTNGNQNLNFYGKFSALYVRAVRAF